MAIIKCKMCGGDMEISADKTFGTCEYCGCTMTLPRVDDDQRAAAFNRGNHFRRIGEFDKALAVYERIVQENETDAEAHWCCALCRFGIEYVEDPATYEWIPTCHRASFDSFLEDVDYLAAVEHSDGITKRQYRKDGAKIAEIQRGILATSQTEEPYDVFICYKESDENGERTRDSALAQDIYYQLTEQGRRVFFARITLEDMVGKQYEPYIFAALHSAKVMVVVGTKTEYLNAVWVKNEWSRFLAMMKHDRGKILLPCYRDMDPYDLPEQLSVLQSYDMSKIGFIQDLTRGISKVLDADKKSEMVKETVVLQQNSGPGAASLLERANLFLEDGNWDSANEYFDKVLDMEPKNAEAYLGRLCVARRARKLEDLERYDGSNDPTSKIKSNDNYQKVIRFGSDALRYKLDEVLNSLIEQRNQKYYNEAVAAQLDARNSKEMAVAVELFCALASYKDAAAQAENCRKKAAELANAEQIAAEKKAEAERLDALEKQYDEALALMNQKQYDTAAKAFRDLGNFKDAAVNADRCDKLEQERQAEEAKQRARKAQENAVRREKNKKISVIATSTVAIVITIVLVVTQIVIPNGKYNDALELVNAGKYEEAITAFELLNGYKDSAELMKATQYQSAENYLSEGKKYDAAIAFWKLNDYKDARDRCFSLWGELAQRNTISGGEEHTVGLRTDGTVMVVGDTYGEQCDVSDWTDIIAVSAGGRHTVGLRSDGTVVAVDDQSDIKNWADIVDISVGDGYTVGLRANGTVVVIIGDAEDGQCDIEGWTDIVAISAGARHIVGLCSNGMVVAVGDNRNGQCDVEDWTDIVAISAGTRHTVGLRSDGTVVAVGNNEDGRCDIEDWMDIVAISAGVGHTVGLHADGTVVAVGDNIRRQCDVDGWMDIVAVSTGGRHTIGLRADGTIVATGKNDSGQCDVSGWSDIKLPTNKER